MFRAAAMGTNRPENQRHRALDERSRAGRPRPAAAASRGAEGAVAIAIRALKWVRANELWAEHLCEAPKEWADTRIWGVQRAESRGSGEISRGETEVRGQRGVGLGLTAGEFAVRMS